MSDVFVSYTHKDRPRVRLIVEALQQQGWSVWWDRKILAGETWDQVIENAIGAAKCVVVVWSKASVESRPVKSEAYYAFKREILVPVMIDDVEIPVLFGLVQTIRLVGWSGDVQHPEFANLLKAVAKYMGQSGMAETDRAAIPGEADQDEILIAEIQQLIDDSAKSHQEPSSGDPDKDLLRQLDELLG
jgi:sulfatase modifying factor 1